MRAVFWKALVGIWLLIDNLNEAAWGTPCVSFKLSASWPKSVFGDPGMALGVSSGTGRRCGA